MRYRLATMADAHALAQMNYRLIQDEGHRNPMAPHELTARMESWLAGEYQAALFEADDGPIGYALFRFEPDSVYIRQFFVHAESRRCGLGRQALAWLAEHVFPPGSRLRIEVLTGNAAAIQFWRAVGFADYALTMEKRA